MINLIPVACIGVPIISSGISVGTAIWKQKKLEAAMEMLEGKVDINVDDHYVKYVIDTTIKNNVNTKIDEAAESAVYKVKADIYKEVEKKVNAIKNIRVEDFLFGDLLKMLTMLDSVFANFLASQHSIKIISSLPSDKFAYSIFKLYSFLYYGNFEKFFNKTNVTP